MQQLSLLHTLRFCNHGQGITFFKAIQIVLTDMLQACHRFHISVKIEIRIGRMIILPVEIQKAFIGQIGNGSRQPTGFIAIGGFTEN